MSTQYTITGARGATIKGDLRRSGSWRTFVEWLFKSCDERGWAHTTQTELGTLLHPKWHGADSHRARDIREWQQAGYLIETGEHDYAIGRVKSFGIGLTLKGVAACRDCGIRNIPPAVAPTPTHADIAYADHSRDVVQIGPPDSVKAQRINSIRETRDALTYALWLLDHPQKCERQHCDDLTADELFDLAVAKAKRAVAKAKRG